MKLYCDTTRIYPETKLVDPEYYSCNIPLVGGNAETSSEIILTEGYSFPKGRNAIQIIYRTGYKPEEMPESIKTAVLATELPEIMEKMNDETETEWLLPFETINTDKSRMDTDRKP